MRGTTFYDIHYVSVYLPIRYLLCQRYTFTGISPKQLPPKAISCSKLRLMCASSFPVSRLAICVSGSKQMSLPAVFGLAACGPCKEASHHLDHHMRDLEAFGHCEVEAAAEFLRHLIEQPDVVRHAPFIRGYYPENFGVPHLTHHVQQGPVDRFPTEGREGVPPSNAPCPAPWLDISHNFRPEV